MAEKWNPETPQDERVTGTSNEETRGVADDEFEEFDDSEDLDDEEDEESTTF